MVEDTVKITIPQQVGSTVSCRWSLLPNFNLRELSIKRYEKRSFYLQLVQEWGIGGFYSEKEFVGFSSVSLGCCPWQIRKRTETKTLVLLMVHVKIMQQSEENPPRWLELFPLNMVNLKPFWITIWRLLDTEIQYIMAILFRATAVRTVFKFCQIKCVLNHVQ